MIHLKSVNQWDIQISAMLTTKWNEGEGGEEACQDEMGRKFDLQSDNENQIYS